ncbi:MAG: molybdenum cofactor biosynthesis protein MoaE [Planctomycetota bacterium]
MAVRVELTDDAIDPATYHSLLGDDDRVGAQLWFHGVTRRLTKHDGRSVIDFTELLFYDAHRSMALSELNRLAGDACKRFEIADVVIVHKLGNAPVGQISVLVGVGSPHRRAAIDAVAWIMDTLKRDVPIWKREQKKSGSTHWVHPE